MGISVWKVGFLERWGITLFFSREMTGVWPFQDGVDVSALFVETWERVVVIVLGRFSFATRSNDVSLCYTCTHNLL